MNRSCDHNDRVIRQFSSQAEGYSEASLFLPTSKDSRIKRALDYTAQHMQSELPADNAVSKTHRPSRRHFDSR